MHEHDGAIYVNAREWRILEGGYVWEEGWGLRGFRPCRYVH